jgi:hypothetical protein
METIRFVAERRYPWIGLPYSQFEVMKEHFESLMRPATSSTSSYSLFCDAASPPGRRGQSPPPSFLERLAPRACFEGARPASGVHQPPHRLPRVGGAQDGQAGAVSEEPAECRASSALERGEA